MCPFTSAQVPKASWQLVAFFQPPDSLGWAHWSQRWCRDTSAQKLYTEKMLKKGLTWRTRSFSCSHVWCSHDTSGIYRQVSDGKILLLNYLFQPQDNLRRKKLRWLPSVSVLPEINSVAVLQLNIPLWLCWMKWRWSRPMIAITRYPVQWKPPSSLWATFWDCVSLWPWISISQIRYRLRCPRSTSHSPSGLG